MCLQIGLFYLSTKENIGKLRHVIWDRKLQWSDLLQISMETCLFYSFRGSKTEHMKCEKCLYGANMRTVSLKEKADMDMNPIICPGI